MGLKRGMRRLRSRRTIIRGPKISSVNTEMRTLLLSGVLYLLGISVVLLIRPTLMFTQDGTWKEFGTISTEHTVFPFWMFCVVWAIVSYILVLFIVGGEGGAVVTAAAVSRAVSSPLIPTEPPEDLVTPLPTKTKHKKNSEIHSEYGSMKPGYYVLDKRAVKETGTPKYIYVGKAPPSVTSGGGDSSESSGEE